MDVEQAYKLLPELDVDFLVEKGWNCDLYQAGSDVYLTIHEYELPEVYTPRLVDLRIVLPSGYPGGNPDMFYTRPWVNLVSTGVRPLNADVPIPLQDGGEWQRWSRHWTGEWRPGVDSLRTYLKTVQQELARGV